jgi:molecular chaperone HtpG
MPEAAAAPAPETMGFKAEVRELLKLMIHSLYSHRDGIGMNREEAISHLGTIARSGTAEFFGKLTGDAQKDSQLIGQFGVGFYSAFIVADRVEVLSRKAGDPTANGVRWQSNAEGEFTVESIDRAQRGTTVILHLKDDAKEFADPWQVRSLVRRYSDHLAFPVLMPKQGAATLDYETVNQAQALWTRPRSEVTDEEYQNFYRHITHDSSAPLAWSHNRVEGKREYTSLLYVPTQAPFDLFQRDAARGLKLHVRRVFIMDDAEQFLPLYLRFVKGVLDSSDLPLNVSRELLQKDPEVEAMRGALTRRALDMLAKLAKDEPEKYAAFWKEFGTVLKEGVTEDYSNRDKLLPLLRFASTHEASDEDRVALADYVARMPAAQKKIYYVLADSRAAARSSPFIEQLRNRKVEVLLLGDRIDGWIMGQLHEFEGKSFQDAARGDLDLAGLGDEAAKDADAATTAANEPLLKRVAAALGDAVAEVRASARLTESPSCLTRPADGMSESMRRILAAAGRDEMPASKPILELNMTHPLVQRLAGLEGEDFGELSQLLYDQGQLTEQGQLANPGDYARRLNRLLLKLLA